jgi:LPXTG-motif cell wall-anchored protein
MTSPPVAKDRGGDMELSVGANGGTSNPVLIVAFFVLLIGFAIYLIYKKTR